ncbi:TetR/AcrR family transcriptional regulator [Demequina flava]|uniref:TetR/AcrR family transcriptional regulator n=1 Tax=Demequina flava TaxID=1095025 RepID=UPI00078449DD|nr:TetR/AcrR family transcriptional regulator [Demequina flava]
MTAMQENSPVRTRRSPKGEARRTAIVASATRLFAQGGLDSVSLTDIAEDVGITKAGLLHHFPTKNDLLLGVLRKRDRVGEVELPDDPVEALMGFIDVLRANEADPSEMQFFAMMSTQSIATDHPAHGHFQQRQAMMRDGMTAMLAELFDESRLAGQTQLSDVADWIVALADGLRNEWLRAPDRINRTESLFRFLESMADAMHNDVRTRLVEQIAQRRSAGVA